MLSKTTKFCPFVWCLFMLIVEHAVNHRCVIYTMVKRNGIWTEIISCSGFRKVANLKAIQKSGEGANEKKKRKRRQKQAIKQETKQTSIRVCKQTRKKVQKERPAN